MLVKDPFPTPSNEELFEIVGLELVCQQIPLDRIEEPPLFVISPPPDAEFEVILLIA